MNKREKDCYLYMLDLTSELAKSYDMQYADMEDFARWNLPDEIGLEWIDAKDMDLICGLADAEEIPKEMLDLFNQIVDNFDLEFEHKESVAWTHEGMRLPDGFWATQRKIAQRILDIAQNISIEIVLNN